MIQANITMPKPCDTTIDAILQRIRKIRIEKNFSQDYVAAKLNISQNAYSRMELGVTEVNLARFFKLAKVLEVELSYLLNTEISAMAELDSVRAKSNSLLTHSLSA